MRFFTWYTTGLLTAAAASGQTLFTDITGEGLAPTIPTSRSFSFGDADNDGWPDIFRSVYGHEHEGRILLLHNEANGRFADRTFAIEAELPGGPVGGGAIFGDYDNDGDQDLFVPFGSFWNFGPARNLLLRNDRGTFVDVALAAGLVEEFPTDNAIWLDYDRDGYLDLYTGNLSCGSDDPAINNVLYRNGGDGTFANMTADVGLDVTFGGCWGAATAAWPRAISITMAGPICTWLYSLIAIASF